MKVYNKNIDKDIPKDAVYVGRPSKWGNPYKLNNGIGLNREEVVQAYMDWFVNRPEFMEEVRKELKGKDLVCWCAPKACHADVLLEIANK